MGPVAGKEQAMYTVIRKYDLIPGTLEEFIKNVQKSLVPILNPGAGVERILFGASRRQRSSRCQQL
jgi:hypothetical protein